MVNVKERLKEFENKIKKIKITYDYDETYTNLLNACIDYQNEFQNWEFENLFDDFVGYDVAEELAKRELENGGLLRLRCFLNDTNFYNREIFRINGYGNLENVKKEDLELLKEDIIEKIDELIKIEE